MSRGRDRLIDAGKGGPACPLNFRVAKERDESRPTEFLVVRGKTSVDREGEPEVASAKGKAPKRRQTDEPDAKTTHHVQMMTPVQNANYVTPLPVLQPGLTLESSPLDRP